MTSIYEIIHFCGIYSLHNIRLIITYHIFSKFIKVFCSSEIRILISTSGLYFKLSILFLGSNLQVLMLLVKDLFRILHNSKAVLFDPCTIP